MQPCMSEAELRLFECFVRCSDRYLEFGSGESTCRAAGIVRSSITAIDSSRSWLDGVAKYCSDHHLPAQPTLIHADIGPTGDWGYPTDPGTRDKWPSYHNGVWTHADALGADLCLVDGRFRVACFMQIILHVEPETVILFHDFRSRTGYHIVREVAREVAMAGELSAFLPIKGVARTRAQDILRDYEFECL